MKTILNTIEKYNMINQNDHILLGISGGCDSMALLHFLNSIKSLYNLKITGIHINHSIRTKSKKSIALKYTPKKH